MSSFSIEKLRTLIANKQISFSKLESQAGLSVGGVANIISGRSKNPTIDTLTKICSVLGCSVDEMLINDSSTHVREASYIRLINKEEWRADLYLKVVYTCEDLFIKSHLSLDLRTAMNIILEVYLYSIQQNNGQLDMKFIEWTIKKISK